MTIMRRSAGWGVILLSACGVFVCGALNIGVWAGKSRVDPIVVAVFGTTDEALGFVGGKLELARQALDKSQERVSGLSRIVERIKNADAQSIREYDPLLQSIDEVFNELKAAESWLESGWKRACGLRRQNSATVTCPEWPPDRWRRLAWCRGVRAHPNRADNRGVAGLCPGGSRPGEFRRANGDCRRPDPETFGEWP